MNNPHLYHKANDVQRHDAERIIKEYSSKIQWRLDGCDSLIDLGSGTGDVLMDFLYPRLPNNFQRLVCSDISPINFNYARSQFGHIEGAEFRVFDMGTPGDLPRDLGEQFDHVTSFYSLMYVQNQSQGLKNIFDLLRPQGGDCLLVSVASHVTFDAYKLTSQMEKWSKYMQDVDAFISPLQFSKDPGREYTELMAEAGFCDYSVDIQQRIFAYDSLEVFKTNMIAVNPFLDRLPVSLHDDYMYDFLSMVLKRIGLQMKTLDYTAKFPVPYRLLVAYGRKPRFICSKTF